MKNPRGHILLHARCALLLAAIGLGLPVRAMADLTIVEQSTLIWNNDLDTKRTAKDVVYTAWGKERIDDYEDGALHLSTLYDPAGGVKAEVNWLARTYTVASWHRRTSYTGANGVGVTQKPTNNYRTILGHRCRLFLDSGMPAPGDVASGLEWIAADLPADLKSPIQAKGRALAYETTVQSGHFTASTQAVSLSTKPIDKRMFSIPSSFRRVNQSEILQD